MAILEQRASDVRLNEIDLSQVVTSNSATIAAQVVVSTQGPTEPTRYTNAQQYMNDFGIPNAQVSFDVYCGLDYFKEGNDLWAVRCVGAGALYSSVLLYMDGTDMKMIGISAGVANPTNPDWNTLVPAPGNTPIALFYPNKGPGSYGQRYAVSINSNNIATPTGLTVTSATTGGSLPAATYSYQIAAIGVEGETLASSTVQVVIAGAGTTNRTILEWDLVENAIGYRIYGRTTAGLGLLVELGQGVNTFSDTGVAVPDTTKQPITNPADAPPPDPEFTVNFYDLEQNTTIPVESFLCTLGYGTDADGNATELSERINPFSQYMKVSTNVPTLSSIPDVDDIAMTQLEGGNSGTAPTSFDVAAAWGVFTNKQLYSINLMINSGHADPIVQKEMERIARTRGDTVAFLDVPSNQQQFQQAINYRNLDLNINSSYACLFCPDVLEADTINGKQQYVPLSGWAAALVARTNRVANPSFSIAGLNRGLLDVLKTRYTYDDAQATNLFKAQVNYPRTFIGQGIALWEQQTMLAKQTALSWFSVRNISNVIKVSLYRFGLYVIQEPNDDATRMQLVQSFSDYLETVKNARGISSYTVVCDNYNNPAAYVNSGILRATVIIVPTIPVHELRIDFVISKEGVSFTETLRQLYGNGT